MTTENLPLNNLMQIFNPNALIKTQLVTSHIIRPALSTYYQIKKHYLSCRKHLKLDYEIPTN